MTDLSDDLVDANEDASLERPELDREPPTPPWIDLLERAQDSDDPEVVARFVAGLDRMAAQVKQARTEAADHLVLCLGGRRFLATDELRVEVKRSTPRGTWQHVPLHEAIHRLANRAALRLPVQYDRDTGEQIDDRVLGVECAVDAYRKACPSGAWTAGGVAGLGLDPDEFSERGTPTESVSVLWLESDPF